MRTLAIVVLAVALAVSLALWLARRPGSEATRTGGAGSAETPERPPDLRAPARGTASGFREAPRSAIPNLSVVPRDAHSEDSAPGFPEPPVEFPPRAADEPEDECDDGDPCTVSDRVVDGECRGEPITCDDGNPMTIDECTGRGCQFRPVPGTGVPAIP